jgi:hypothetical protein
LEKTHTTIPGHHGKPTQKPTLAQVMKYFDNINVVYTNTEFGKRRDVVGLLPIHHLIMKLLDVSPEVYFGIRGSQRN